MGSGGAMRKWAGKWASWAYFDARDGQTSGSPVSETSDSGTPSRVTCPARWRVNTQCGPLASTNSTSTTDGRAWYTPATHPHGIVSSASSVIAAARCAGAGEIRMYLFRLPESPMGSGCRRAAIVIYRGSQGETFLRRDTKSPRRRPPRGRPRSRRADTHRPGSRAPRAGDPS
jgi:hypothetical protein